MAGSAVAARAAPAEMTAEIIRLVDVSKVYGTGDATVRAVDAVTLSVNEGDFLAVMGPSGSGKSVSYTHLRRRFPGAPCR